MAERTCAHCGRPTPTLERGQCHTCAQYWRRTGRERPLVPRPPRLCQTCGQPTRIYRRGRCPACAEYWRLYGRERPPRLWARQ
jgi:hypothetical protein